MGTISVLYGCFICALSPALPVAVCRFPVRDFTGGVSGSVQSLFSNREVAVADGKTGRASWSRMVEVLGIAPTGKGNPEPALELCQQCEQQASPVEQSRFRNRIKWAIRVPWLSYKCWEINNIVAALG